jgi:CCR4-NOT complex subunit CAF16
MNSVVRSDIVVADFLDSVGGYRHKRRRDRLLDILDVDLDWCSHYHDVIFTFLIEAVTLTRHMHTISDGERRRVQICMGLMRPWDVLLLDEVRVSVDGDFVQQ